MYSLRDKYAIAGIAGIGWTDYSKNSGRTVRSLASEACLNAIGDAGLDVEDIDGFVSFNFNGSVPAIAVASEIGVPAARYAMDFISGGKTDCEVRFVLTDHAAATLPPDCSQLLGAVRAAIKGRTNVSMTVVTVPLGEPPEFTYKARRWMDQRQQGYWL